MDNNMTRLISTAVIWTALTIILVAMVVNNALDFWLAQHRYASRQKKVAMVVNNALDFWMAALTIGSGVGVTAVVWFSQMGNSQADRLAEAEKVKRRGRVDRVLERLNEAELAELRARLAETDGELLTLEELVQDEDRRTRGY
ncbi:MAG: hypothetical protein BroJett038_13280 [Chloroflexota bacterium]|nr:MAG: hypothetical protein BroJett038_13280 [Chloroflexota bacterium]